MTYIGIPKRLIMFLQCWDDLQYFVVQRQDDLLLFGSVSFFYWIAFTGTKEFHDSRILIRAPCIVSLPMLFPIQDLFLLLHRLDLLVGLLQVTNWK